jgi:arylsulfatase A-like enzyme
MGKQNAYDHSMRVPLILAGPGIPRGERRDALCTLCDVYPTVCDLTGLSVPGSVEGTSLVPVLLGRSKTHADSLFFAYKDVQRAVRTDRHKLIEYTVAGQRTTQLFDLDADPWETRSLAGDPAQAGQISALRARLRQWQRDLDDTRIDCV